MQGGGDPQRGCAEVVSDEDDTSRASTLRSVQAKRKRPAVGIAIVVLLFVVPGLLFFVIPLGITTYDNGHRMTISCGVRSATTGSESSGSFKGGGASGAQVVVVTDDCGKVLLQDGINSFNAKRVAKAIDDARQVRFTIGEASYALRGALAVFGVSPAAYDYEIG